MNMSQLQVNAISQGTFLKSQEVTQKSIILKQAVKLPTFTIKKKNKFFIANSEYFEIINFAEHEEMLSLLSL